MLTKGQIYIFNTTAIQARIPDADLEWITLTIAELDYDDRFLRFEPGVYNILYTSTNLERIFHWIRHELPKLGLDQDALCDPLGFERLIGRGYAKPLHAMKV